jgi:hypothetical protein
MTPRAAKIVAVEDAGDGRDKKGENAADISPNALLQLLSAHILKPQQQPLAPTPLPEFDGRNEDVAKSFLRKWMLHVGRQQMTADEKAEYFSACFPDRSPASKWYNKLADEVREDYEEVLERFRERWVSEVEEPEDSVGLITDVLKTKIADSDVGRKTVGGKDVLLEWARRMKGLFDQMGKDASEELKGSWMLCNCGPELQNVLYRKVADVNLKTVHTAILRLLPHEIHSIKIAVATRTLLAASASSVSRGNYTPRVAIVATAAEPAVAASVASATTNSTTAGTKTKAKELGRELTDQPEEHIAAVRAWEAKNGGKEITADSDYPLTPGTEPAGTFECWACGLKTPPRHRADTCPNKKVEKNQEIFRMRVAMLKRSQGTLGAASGVNATPLGTRTPAAVNMVDTDDIIDVDADETYDMPDWMQDSEN